MNFPSATGTVGFWDCCTAILTFQHETLDSPLKTPKNGGKMEILGFFDDFEAFTLQELVDIFLMFQCFSQALL